MLSRVKNFFKTLIVKESLIAVEIKNEELARRLNELLYAGDLVGLFTDPVNKMYLMSTYTNSLDDLLSNLLTKGTVRNIIAVDMNTFMKGNVHNVYIIIKRIVPLIEKNKISSPIEHDLYEFLTMCEMFIGEK